MQTVTQRSPKRNRRVRRWPLGLRILHRIFFLDAVARQRRHLRDMPDHILDDIGVTHDEAWREAVRPPWDAPPSWKL